MPKKGFLQHLQEGGVIIGDGSYIFTLERRGFVLAGPYTPEVVMEHPEAVAQLSREYANAGAQVIQALTYAASEDKLSSSENSSKFTCEELNDQAVNIARKVASSIDGYICGGITATPSFEAGLGEENVKKQFRKMVKIFLEKEVDFLLGEFFSDVKEAIWAVEVMKEETAAKGGGTPVAVTMTMGPTGDLNDVTPEECAVSLARAGADVVGLNCSFDPDIVLKTISQMKDGLAEAGLQPFLMAQPCGFHCQETENVKLGYYTLPDYPYALEPRTLTRIDCYAFARGAYSLGVRYVGGCCGFEPHHIRAIAMELEEEIGRPPPGSRHASKWGESLDPYCGVTHVGEDYWTNLVPGAGREKIQTFSTPETGKINLV